MAWYGARGIPVELNEPHHWGMRDAPDVVFVVAAYLSAYNARALRRARLHRTDDVQQSARPLGCDGSGQDAGVSGDDRAPCFGRGRSEGSFRIYRQTRVGLLSHPLDPEAARGHLAAATYLQMALKPHIVHVVGHTEAHHAATAEDVIAACKVARRAIENAVAGAPDMTG